jgi:hypothetical protein
MSKISLRPCQGGEEGLGRAVMPYCVCAAADYHCEASATAMVHQVVSQLPCIGCVCVSAFHYRPVTFKPVCVLWQPDQHSTRPPVQGISCTAAQGTLSTDGVALVLCVSPHCVCIPIFQWKFMRQLLSATAPSTLMVDTNHMPIGACGGVVQDCVMEKHQASNSGYAVRQLC